MKIKTGLSSSVFPIALLTVTCSLLISAASLADGEKKKEALQSFNDGKALFNDKQYAAAAEAFRKANELNPNWKLLYNIGQSEAAAKRHGLALQAFEAYLSQGGDDITDTRREEVLREVKRLRDMVGFIQVKAPDGAVVTIDDLERGTAPILGQIPVAASVNHNIIIVLGDEELTRQTVAVTGRQTAVVEVALPEVEPPPEPATPPPDTEEEPEREPMEEAEPEAPQGPPEPADSATESGSSALKTWGWATFSVGGLMIVGSLVTGGMALALNGKVEKNCPDGYCPPPSHDDLENRNSLALTTDILLIVGGVAITSGMLMVIFAKGKERGTEKVSLQPIVTPTAVGSTIEWRF